MNSVIELPFNQHVGLQTADDPAKVLQLPAGPQYLNHLGTVHASAQLALAEASSGEFLLRAIGDLTGIVPVVRRLESKFRKPANGRLTSTASAPDGIESLRSELEAKGRALITVQVELHDESGVHTLSASVEWFVTRVTPAQITPDMVPDAAFLTADGIEAFILEFEACALSKRRWTHHAHLVVALWYLTHHTSGEALEIVRQRIRAYNEATGTPNTDGGGYHETLTRIFLDGVATHIAEHREEPLPVSLAALLRSPLGGKDWPLRFYSRERLFSMAARHHWLEPDRP